MNLMTTAHATVPPQRLQRDDLVVRPGPFTVADRDALPDDGRRQELLDGVLILGAAPSTRHQDVALHLAMLLKQVVPADFKVIAARFDVRRGDDTAIQPDVVVAPRADVRPTGSTLRPVLAVEVTSPSTRFLDLGRKMEVLAEIGCESYWTIEPHGADDLPELTAWRLVDGRYEVEAQVAGRDSWTATHPYAVTVVPADLLDD